MYKQSTDPQNTIGITLFRDYVKDLPHQWILDYLIVGADMSRRILSSAMVKESIAKFVTKAALVKRYKALPPQLRLKCAQVYLMGRNGLSLAEPQAYAKEPLLESLLVFAAQNGAGLGGVRLFGFDEFEPTLRPLMAEALAGWGMAGESSTPAVCLWRPLNDIAAVCSLAMHGHLKRSIHGGLARSALNALKRLVSDPTLTGKSVSEGLPGHPAGFLIGFCLKEGIIVDAEAEYVLNRARFAAWLEKNKKERLQKLTDYAYEFLGGVGLNLARELLECAAGNWVSVDALVPEVDRPALIRTFSVFEFLGYGGMGPGSSSDNARFASYKIVDGDVDKIFAKEPKRDTLIMSDFAVVIPQEISPAELFNFSKIGMLTAFDKVYKGEITKESVSNALSAGADPSYLREWLRGRQAAVNVVKTVDEWIREFSRLCVSRGPVLVSSSEKVTKQITSLEPLRKHLVEMNAHTVFGIRHGSEQKVLDILHKLGFDTRTPGEQESGQLMIDSTQPALSVCKAANPLASEEKLEEFPSSKKLWEPITVFSHSPSTPVSPMNRTKYGAGLKALELNEMIQVVDYTLLTNQALIMDYAGSASINQGIYTVVPARIDKGIDAAVEAEIPGVRGKTVFYLEKIRRIGVVVQ
jgi:hypothetical protein